MNPSATAPLCPRCSRSTATPFGEGGVCLMCAGQRALALDLDDADPLEPPATAGTSRSPFGGELPEHIGPYAIIDEIGRGGMARVFVARQPRLDRLVALKVLSGPAAHSDLAARFLREANTVARLRHPHIIALHDSGRADGAIYFAMDYVEGGDLAARLRARPPAPTEAAELIRKVALALAYAHRQGVLHRDLKPSNILLDGDEPKLADFGLAAELEAGGDLTRVSGVLGTPHYLAPETVTGGSAAASVASDLYSLGVVLYEMVAGRTPFAGATAAEIVARQANEEPPPLRQFASGVPRDLETICLKCLAREPARRYVDTEALAEDLRRWLAGEPILAREPGLRERAARFVRRHRLFVTVSAATGLALAAGTTVSAVLAIRARRAEKSAAREAAAAQAVVSFLKDDLLAKASPDEQPNPRIELRTVLDRAVDTVGPRFAAQPEIERPLREVIGVTYGGLGDYAQMARHLDRARALAERELSPDDPRRLEIEYDFAAALFYSGKPEEASRLQLELLPRFQRHFGPTGARTLVLTNDIGAALTTLGHYQEAEKVLRQALAQSESLPAEHHYALARMRGNLSMVLDRLGRSEEAVAIAERAVADLRREYGVENELAVSLLSTLGGIAGRKGDLERSIALLDEARAIGARVLGPEHPVTLNTMHSLGVAHLSLHHVDEADRLLAVVEEARNRLLGPDHLQSLSTQAARASVLRERGRFAEAAALLSGVVERRAAVLGRDHPTTLRAIETLGRIRIDLKQLDEARRCFDEVYRLRRKKLGPTHPETLQVARVLAEMFEQQSDFAAAEPIRLSLYEQAGHAGDRAKAEAAAARALAQLYTAWGKTDKAAAWSAKTGAGN